MTDIIDWIENRRIESGLSVSQISLKETSQWRMTTDGVIQHNTERFFSITGITSIKQVPDAVFKCQPIINQPEIGILGFIFSYSIHGLKLLIQAKTEPGNIGGTQVAPSVQATLSNYMKVHKGKPTKYLNHFLNHGRLVETGNLQSEQGTRFLSKYNRNISIFIDSETDLCESLASSWSWFNVKNLLNLLDKDYLINTDSRSVLVCSNWLKLADGQKPFINHKDGFGKKLHESFTHISNSDKHINHLNQVRILKKFKTKTSSLVNLNGWKSLKKL